MEFHFLSIILLAFFGLFYPQKGLASNFFLGASFLDDAMGENNPEAAAVREEARKQFEQHRNALQARNDRAQDNLQRFHQNTQGRPLNQREMQQLAGLQRSADAAQDELNNRASIETKLDNLGVKILDGWVNTAFASVNAEIDRKKVVAEVATKQTLENRGAMERLQHLTTSENIGRVSLAIGCVGAALIASYYLAKFGYYYGQKFIGMPKLVRESSEKNLWEKISGLFFKQQDQGLDFLNQIVLNDELAQIVGELAQAAYETKHDGIPFRNVILYGEPGTGKTMIARQIARHCRMDYVILSGADFSQFEEGKDIEQLHLLFDRAEKTEKGLIIFIDEADAALRDRKNMDNRGKALVDAFLSRTGTKSEKFMIILATNHPQELDPAVLSRFSKKVHISLPDIAERAKILQLYLSKYFVNKATTLNGEHVTVDPALDLIALQEIARELEGMSGRDLEDLIGELRYVLSSKQLREVTMDVLKAAADQKLKQRQELSQYDGHAAAHKALAGQA